MTSIRRGFADTPDGQIHYRAVEGPGTPVLLLHRTPVDSSSYEAMLRFLAGRRAAIALDTPGFGQSFKPEGSPSTEDYARWFLQAADDLGVDRFHICGHHTGTHIGAEMAKAAPERVQSLLLNGVIYARDPAERAERRAQIGPAQGIDDEGRYFGDLWRLMKSLYFEFDAGLIHAETMGALTAIRGRDQAFDAIYAQEFPEVLRQVQCPIRVVQAADDMLTLSGMLDRVREERTEIRIEIIGSAGMAAPERQPGAFARGLLNFISDDKDIQMTNRRYELVRSDSGYDLQRADTTRPEPGPGEVVVKVHAVSLNRRDVSIRDLSYPVSGADHFVPGSDAAGEIIAVGEGVTEWKVGDRVASTFFQNWQGDRLYLPAVLSALGAGGAGVLADEIVLSAKGVVRIPDDWSYAEGASLVCAGVTAWSALKIAAELRKDDWVLIIGTGGVALFALQIAVASGAKVLILSSSEEKIEQAKAMGATAGINYRDIPDWAPTVKELTGYAGANHALELGGAGTMERTLASMAIGGHVAMIGALDGFGGEIPGLAMIMAALRVSAIVVGPREGQQALTDFFVANNLRPVIDSEFTFDQADEAYRRLNAGAFGKVVITL